MQMTVSKYDLFKLKGDFVSDVTLIEHLCVDKRLVIV